MFADKLSAIAGRKYLKGRDIFDLWFLKVNDTKIDRELFLKKLNDYSTPEKNFSERINSVAVENIKNDLLNFLPKVYRDKFEKENYSSIIKSVKEIAKELHKK
ncbi:MAG: nucleotidyl transferase AbiEii/AbiGii toxin family protein [Elusimicrobia bacterium]|nr:nucleotidyl transferase AbiEii/AbiGii toxin family protein [Elusimicrobiota bacterium]